MNLFKKIIQTSCSVLPTNLLVQLSGLPVLLPYHHVVSDENLPHIKELYPYKSRKEFINDLDWLLKRFKAIHPNELAESIFHQKPIEKKSFLLSFDDGFREVYDVIAPILIEKGVPAIFFINSAFIDNKELFYRCKLSLVLTKVKTDKSLAEKVCQHINHNYSGYNSLRNEVLKINYPNQYIADELGQIAETDFEDFLSKQKPFLTTEQITCLLSQNFVFGGHSADHPDYKLLSIDEQCNQTINSIKHISQFQQDAFHYFAFPHEDKYIKQEFFARMHETDPNCLFFGLQNQRKENQNLILHRFNAERPSERMSAIIKTVLMYNSILRMVNRQNIVRKFS
jgi:peptidoglycan/xylan/chitin deacetylase (PgdA/CDA1 family)